MTKNPTSTVALLGFSKKKPGRKKNKAEKPGYGRNYDPTPGRKISKTRESKDVVLVSIVGRSGELDESEDQTVLEWLLL